MIMLMMMMMIKMKMMMMMQMLIMVITKLRMIMRKGAGTHDGPNMVSSKRKHVTTSCYMIS